MATNAAEPVVEAQTSSNVESTTMSEAPQPNGKDSSHHQQNGRDSNNNRGRGKFQRRHGNRSNYESLPESNDAEEIRRQVEFYFSDSNLPVDAYLLKLTGGSENKPVPLKTIHDFKRMRHFQPFSAVRNAVKASDILDLNDDNEIIRKTPLDSRYTLDVSDNKKIAQEISLPRSVYAKGFGFEHPTTQLEIETYFEPFGPVNSVRMRRHADGNFKGSVFVEFADEQLAKQFLELDIHPPFAPNGTAAEETSEEQTGKSTQIDGGEGKGTSSSATADGTTSKASDTQLQIMSKQAYLQSKGRDAEEEFERPSSNRKQQNAGGRGDKHNRGRGRGRGGRGGGSRHDGIDKDDWKKRRDNDQQSSRHGRSERKSRSDHRGEYRDVNVEDDEDRVGDTTGTEDKSKKRGRDEDAGDASDAPAKKAKAEDQSTEAS